jgi:tagaturonate reductase
LIRSVNREISAYADYDAFLRLAHNPEMRFVFSNTTEAGISYHAGDRFDDAPPVSYPAKLTRCCLSVTSISPARPIRDG